MKIVKWTRDEIAKLRSMRRKKWSRKKIAAALGRTEGSVEGKINDLDRPMIPAGMPGPRPSQAELSDREKRLDIPPRDLTAWFFGDPLPGYSALDRRAHVD